jgi:hypothetical protein
MGSAAGPFEPGRFLARGYTITTRGCQNQCAYCCVPEREGRLRELPIRDGWDLLDNNLLAASRSHIEAVLEMLSRQPKRARFTGGLEARRVEPWFAKALKTLGADAAFLAYDRPEDRVVVKDAAMLLVPSIRSRRLGCYVLCGFDGDTLQAARERCQYVTDLGMRAYPMFFRPYSDKKMPIPYLWHDFIWMLLRGLPATADKKDAGMEVEG